MNALTVGSLFAGVEGFGQGLEAAGFTVAWQVEIDNDAVSVLERHYPNVRRYRDVTEVNGAELAAVDVLVGGFPCQDLSVAGHRKGLAGARSGLFFEVARIAAETAAPWLLLENVDGLLSSWVTHDPPPADLGVGQTWQSDESSSLGVVLSTLADGGYGWAYRVLDAQYLGVPQRRRRAFIVGCLGASGARAAEVLFEPESVLWDLASCLAPRQGAPSILEDGAGSGGVANTLLSYAGRKQLEQNYVPMSGQGVRDALTAHGGSHGRIDAESETFVVANTIQASAGHHGHSSPRGDGSDNLVVAAPLTAGGHPNSHAPGRHREDDENLVAVALSENQRGELRESDVASALGNGGGKPGQGYPCVAFNWQAGGSENDQSFRGKSRQYIERAGDYAGALSATRHDAVALSNTPDTSTVMGYNYGIGDHIYAVAEARSREVLRRMRPAFGEEAFQQWAIGVTEHLRQEEVLRCKVHGEELRCSAESVSGLGNDALPCAEAGAPGSVFRLLQASWPGCPPHRWRSYQQLTRELGETLSKLPSEAAQATVVVLALREAGEGLRLLLDALPAVQALGRSEQDGDTGARSLQGVRLPDTGERAGTLRPSLHAGETSGNAQRMEQWSVRRLMPIEAERLMSWPDQHTAYRADGSLIPDGPRYRMIGNGVVSNVSAWIGRRLRSVMESSHAV